jgi:hypothetical protein
MIKAKPKIVPGLIAGKVYQDRAEEIRTYFNSKHWFFWSPKDIKERIISLSNEGYENDPSIITAKILNRSSKKTNIRNI